VKRTKNSTALWMTGEDPGYTLRYLIGAPRGFGEFMIQIDAIERSLARDDLSTEARENHKSIMDYHAQLVAAVGCNNMRAVAGFVYLIMCELRAPEQMHLLAQRNANKKYIDLDEASRQFCLLEQDNLKKEWNRTAKIKEVAKIMGVSWPTLRRRLAEDASRKRTTVNARKLFSAR
jgi:hypothetical protein